MRRMILLVLLLISSSFAVASSYAGKISKLRFGVGLTSVARVSILTSQPTSCGNPGWLVYENADTGVGKLWSSTLLAAQAAQRTVVIAGTGTCDSLGYELVEFIDID